MMNQTSNNFNITNTVASRIIQILYKNGCFDIISIQNIQNIQTQRFSLKPYLRNYDILRKRHDSEIIKIANDVGIYMNCVSWSYTLYGNESKVSYIQSIIDKLKAEMPLRILHEKIYNLPQVPDHIKDIRPLIEYILGLDLNRLEIDTISLSEAIKNISLIVRNYI